MSACNFLPPGGPLIKKKLLALIVDMNIESDLSESGDEFEREVKKRLHNKEKEKQKQAIGDFAATHSHHLVIRF